MKQDTLRQFRTNRRRDRAHGSRTACLIALALLALLGLAGCSSPDAHLDWRLNTSVHGHMPDLDFQLTDDSGHTVTGEDYRGKTVILYFGYTHCPDVCPLTLTHLHMVMQKLGTKADDVRILFVSVDPARDTPEIMHRYVNAFDKHAVGLTGTERQIRDIAKRYRVAYNRGKENGRGGYEVSHSSALYIFDHQGRIRLLATPSADNDDIAHDLDQLITLENRS